VSAGIHKLLTPQHPLTKKKKGEVQYAIFQIYFVSFANSALERVKQKNQGMQNKKYRAPPIINF
jgi:hypothetical protein